MTLAFATGTGSDYVTDFHAVLRVDPSLPRTAVVGGNVIDAMYRVPLRWNGIEGAAGYRIYARQVPSFGVPGGWQNVTADAPRGVVGAPDLIEGTAALDDDAMDVLDGIDDTGNFGTVQLFANGTAVELAVTAVTDGGFESQRSQSLSLADERPPALVTDAQLVISASEPPIARDLETSYDVSTGATDETFVLLASEPIVANGTVSVTDSNRCVSVASASITQDRSVNFGVEVRVQGNTATVAADQETTQATWPGAPTNVLELNGSVADLFYIGQELRISDNTSYRIHGRVHAISGIDSALVVTVLGAQPASATLSAVKRGHQVVGIPGYRGPFSLPIGTGIGTALELDSTDLAQMGADGIAKRDTLAITTRDPSGSESTTTVSVTALRWDPATNHAMADLSQALSGTVIWVERQGDRLSVAGIADSSGLPLDSASDTFSMQMRYRQAVPVVSGN